MDKGRASAIAVSSVAMASCDVRSMTSILPLGRWRATAKACLAAADASGQPAVSRRAIRRGWRALGARLVRRGRDSPDRHQRNAMARATVQVSARVAQHARTALAEMIEAAAAVDTADTWLEADATTEAGGADDRADDLRSQGRRNHTDAHMAAEPLLDPPGVRVGSQGLRVRDGCDEANSVVTVFPSTTAPASRSAATAAQSRLPCQPTNKASPAPSPCRRFP